MTAQFSRGQLLTAAALSDALEAVGGIAVTNFDGISAAGNVDCTAGFAALFAEGGEFYVPEGDYLIAYAGADAGGVAVEVTKHTRIRCHPNARFVIQCDNDGLRFSAPSGGVGLPEGGASIEWRGGIIDTTGQRNSTVVPFSGSYPPVNQGESATCDGLSFRGNYTVGATNYQGFARVLIEDATIIAGDHWQTAGGDSGMYLGAGAKTRIVRGCRFQGCRDLGVYASGDGEPENSGTLVIEDCEFVNCMFGAAAKRSMRGFTITANTFINCVSGFNGDTVDGSSDSGTVMGNTFIGCGYAVMLKWSQRVNVSHLNIVSVGATLADGATAIHPYASNKPAGVLLTGASYCYVGHIHCDSVTAANVSAGPVLVYLDDYDLSGTLYGSTQNMIEEVFSTDFSRCVEEEAGSLADLNRIEYCYNYGSAGVRNPLPVGTNTRVIRIDPTTNAPIYRKPVYFADGSAAAPFIARESQTTTGIFGATNKIGISIAGTERFSVTSTAANLPVVTSLNYADDTAAAAGGVAVGGLYHNSGALRVRLV